ncbi:MAG: restriction endonuclease [Thermoflexales bacterium]|nr:restriction endonuclease [Thermoflexales bacterium]
MTTQKQRSRTRPLAAKLIYAAMTILRDNGKEMPMRELLDRVEKVVDLDDWAKEHYEKSGYLRWERVLHFYSIDCIKAGYLVKKRGTWYITPEGEEALKHGPERLLEKATSAYRAWKASQPTAEPGPPDEATETIPNDEIPYEKIEEIAFSGFEQHVNAKNPYEFQELVAALLRGMGYHTPFVAPRGKDGGVDIRAYRDPLGTQSPRLQVQIKHRESTASAQEVRQLMGLLQKDGAVGIFVSTGGFTPDARVTARTSHIHVETVDLARFIELWQQFYDKMTDLDKSLMPLRPVMFLAKPE